MDAWPFPSTSCTRVSINGLARAILALEAAPLAVRVLRTPPEHRSAGRYDLSNVAVFGGSRVVIQGARVVEQPLDPFGKRVHVDLADLARLRRHALAELREDPRARLVFRRGAGALEVRLALEQVRAPLVWAACALLGEPPGLENVIRALAPRMPRAQMGTLALCLRLTRSLVADGGTALCEVYRALARQLEREGRKAADHEASEAYARDVLARRRRLYGDPAKGLHSTALRVLRAHGGTT